MPPVTMAAISPYLFHPPSAGPDPPSVSITLPTAVSSYDQMVTAMCSVQASAYIMDDEATTIEWQDGRVSE